MVRLKYLLFLEVYMYSRSSAGPAKRQKKNIAHREGRTRSLQITALHDSYKRKSLTLYPIELGGR